MIFLRCVAFFVIGFIVGRAPLLREIDRVADAIARNCDTNTHQNILNDLENHDG